MSQYEIDSYLAQYNAKWSQLQMYRSTLNFLRNYKAENELIERYKQMIKELEEELM